MLLNLEMPFVNPIIEGGVVDAWHVAPGDSVSFGDPICDVRIEEALGIKRRIMAYQMLPRRKKGGEQRATKPVNALVNVRASDGGILRRIDVAVGEAVTVGDVMGVFSTEADEPLEDDAVIAAFRAVANIAESGEGESL